MSEDFFEGLDDAKSKLRPKSSDGETLAPENLRSLFEVTKLLNSPAYNYEEILNIILDETIKLTRADRGFLMLYDDADDLDVRIARNMNYEALPEGDRKISQSVVDEVIEKEEGVCVTNIEEDEKLSEMSSILKLKILSVLCVPLKVTHEEGDVEQEHRRISHLATRKILGVIYVDSQSITTSFSEADLDLVQALANSATTAIINAHLYRQATRDKLTGLTNRHTFAQRLADEVKLARKSESPLSLLMIDIDDLQRINKEEGYTAGDQAIQLVADAVAQNVRRLDIPCRYGGEEFAVVLPQTDERGAEEVSKKISKAVRRIPFLRDLDVSLSIGIGGLVGKDGDDKPELVIKRADQALYEAKDRGGDEWRVWSAKLGESGKRTDRLAGIFTGDMSRDYRNVLVLLEAISEVNQTTNLDTLLPMVLDTVIEITQAEHGFIMLKDDRDEWAIRCSRDDQKADIDEPAYSQSVVDKVLDTQTPVCVEDTFSASEEMTQSIEELEIRAVMCVPMVIGDLLIGTIYVDSRKGREKFTESSLAYFHAVAQQAAIAIENARLYQEVHEKTRKIEKLTKQLERKTAELESELEAVQLEDEEERAQKRKSVALRYDYDQIIGKSKPMQRVFRLLDRITDSEVACFVHGESGTGKELVSKALHFNGPRKNERFVAENCAAMTESLLEAELFGHVKGAFTGAHADKKGLFELAHQGTLFLDEIGDMTLSMQKKLLRVLEENEVRRIGGKEVIPIDVRVVSASNKDLKKMVAEGDFREDLYYRLNVVRVDLPPLRERKEDVPLLVEHFLKVEDSPPHRVDDEATDLLMRYNWPGNVRELKNVVERAKIICEGDVVTADAIMLDSDFSGFEEEDKGLRSGGGDEARAKEILRRYDKEGIYFELNERQRKLLEYLETYGSIRNRDYYDRMGVSKSTGWRDIKDLMEKGLIEVHGRGKGSTYSLASQ